MKWGKPDPGPIVHKLSTDLSTAPAPGNARSVPSLFDWLSPVFPELRTRRPPGSASAASKPLQTNWRRRRQRPGRRTARRRRRRRPSRSGRTGGGGGGGVQAASNELAAAAATARATNCSAAAAAAASSPASRVPNRHSKPRANVRTRKPRANSRQQAPCQLAPANAVPTRPARKMQCTDKGASVAPVTPFAISFFLGRSRLST